MQKPNLWLCIGKCSGAERVLETSWQCFHMSPQVFIGYVWMENLQEKDASQ
jgi:hypothetical protein